MIEKNKEKEENRKKRVITFTQIVQCAGKNFTAVTFLNIVVTGTPLVLKGHITDYFGFHVFAAL